MSELKQRREQLAAFGARLGGLAQAQLQSLYREGNLVDEESLTAALCGFLAAGRHLDPARELDASRLDVAVLHKVTEEPSIGADLMIVFESRIPEWTLRTRTLVQAKRAEPGRTMTPTAWTRMHGQVSAMLQHVHESFVLVYSLDEESCVFPALPVAGCSSRDLFDLDCYRFRGFLEGIFCGFIGEALTPDEGRGGSLARHEIRILVEQEQDAGGIQPHPPPPLAPMEGQGVVQGASL